MPPHVGAQGTVDLEVVDRQLAGALVTGQRTAEGAVVEAAPHHEVRPRLTADPRGDGVPPHAVAPGARLPRGEEAPLGTAAGAAGCAWQLRPGLRHQHTSMVVVDTDRQTGSMVNVYQDRQTNKPVRS